ncbi:MAG: leucine-rich repeat protein, partial [Acutalibacteraceae bacterium]
SLTSITIPDSVKTIGDSAFHECDSLTNVTIGNSVEIIGNGAFSWCDSLTSVTIGNSVETVGDSAFSWCNSLTSITIPDSVKTIGDSAFEDCDSLKSVTIGNNVKTIGEWAFSDCKSLTSATIGNSVKTIGNWAFSDCKSLTSATIGNSVENIGFAAFDSCDNLKDVYYTGTSSQWEKIEIEICNECLTGATIHYNSSTSSLVLGKTSKITATQTTSVVTLKWNAVPNATGYKIYQKTDSGWKSLGNVTGTSKTVSGLTAGTKYTFAVKAGAVVNGKTIWSDVYTTINTATKTLVPTKLTSYQDTNSITLFWIKSKGATGYRIYYRANTNSSWQTALSSTTDTNYTWSNLKPNQAFQFAVRPYITTDSGVVWSDYTTITASTTPATPTAKVTSPSKGKVTLTWNAVSGATGYQVYYKSGNGSWKLYKTTSKPTTYTFSNLKSGTKYTFAVRAYRTVEMTNFRSGYKTVSVTVK